MNRSSTGLTGSAAVRIRGLEKRYGRVRAVDGLDLDVAAGEVHGFLGPNGAVKTSTMRILLGLSKATRGDVRVLGGDPWSDAVYLHRRMAAVSGDAALWPGLTGGETIDLLTSLRGGAVRSRPVRAKRAALLEDFALDPTKRVRAYSRGNRQKVLLVAALLLPAELYLFDEPTTGLDPLMQEVFARHVRASHDVGATVLLSSHVLSEAQALCTTVSIVRAGRVVETGSMAELRRRTRTTVSFDAAGSIREVRAALPEARDLSVTGARFSCSVAESDVVAALPRLAALDVTGLVIAPPSLEELFLHQYETESVSAATAWSTS